MKKIITLCSLFFLPLFLFSQSWYKQFQLGTHHDSYIVTLEGDTLHGKIKYETPPAMAGKIKFQEEGEEEFESYKAEALQGFYFQDIFWEVHKFNDGSLNLTGSQQQSYFLYPVMKGKLNVYEQYYSENEGGLNKALTSQMKSKTWLKKGDEKFIPLTHIKFMRFGKGMSKFLSDCEPLANDLKKKRYNKKDYLKVVERYNKCE